MTILPALKISHQLTGLSNGYFFNKYRQTLKVLNGEI